MTSPWTRWVQACTTTEVGTSLALFRMGVGATVFLSCASIAVVADPLLRPLSDGGLGPDAAHHWLVSLLGGPSLAVARALCGVVLLSSAMLTAGLGGRLNALVTLLGMLALHSLSFDIGGGFDRLATNGLWLLVLANSTATLSVDCRLRDGRWTSDRLVYAFPRYLAVLQLVVIYVATGVRKTGHGWDWPYDALYLTFNKYPRLYWDLPWTGDLYPLLQLGTWLSWWWEVLFFLPGLWLLAHEGFFGARAQRLAGRFDLRIPFLGLGLFAHFVLWLFLELHTFTLITWAFYLVMFTPAEWREVLRLR